MKFSWHAAVQVKFIARWKFNFYLFIISMRIYLAAFAIVNQAIDLQLQIATATIHNKTSAKSITEQHRLSPLSSARKSIMDLRNNKMKRK